MTKESNLDVSVVVPAYNEEERIARTLGELRGVLEEMGKSWEIVAVDDGSADGTAREITRVTDGDERVRLLALPHKGKGATVKAGMLAALGRSRLFADADLSLAAKGLRSFFDAEGRPLADVVIASREASGAQRIDEPAFRHLIGKGFNLWVKAMVIRGIDDTQCGFKLFTKQAAEAVFSALTIEGFGFDVEAMYLARRFGFSIIQLPVVWRHFPDSRVGLAGGAGGFADVLRVRLNIAMGRYNRAKK